MISRNVAIGIGILVILGLGFLFFSSMTGDVITGVAVDSMENEYFKISDFGSGSEGELNNGEVKDGEGR